MTHLYNEIDPNAVQWLKNLSAAGEIPPGDVDGRPIKELRGRDLREIIQFHGFAGIGGWPLALRLAGWPENRPVWTGSCPCQPFSVAGKGGGIEDERHVWPDFLRLITECRPPVIFGEQVASKAGRDWLNGVRIDLEALGYAVGAADLCAAGLNAPHIRQRLYWVAYSTSSDAGGKELNTKQKREGFEENRAELFAESGAGCVSDGLGDVSGQRRRGRSDDNTVGHGGQIQAPRLGGLEHWQDFTIRMCGDGKARRIASQSALFPLAHGLPGRVAHLRAYGNAIVPQVAAEFIRAYMETEQFRRKN